MLFHRFSHGDDHSHPFFARVQRCALRDICFSQQINATSVYGAVRSFATRGAAGPEKSRFVSRKNFTFSPQISLIQVTATLCFEYQLQSWVREAIQRDILKVITSESAYTHTFGIVYRTSRTPRQLVIELRELQSQLFRT